jgi:hypothetical protein
MQPAASLGMQGGSIVTLTGAGGGRRISRSRNMKKFVGGVLMAIVCTTASSITSVTVEIESGWRDLNFVIEDLNTADGIAPSLTATGYDLCRSDTAGTERNCRKRSSPFPDTNFPADFRPPSASVHDALGSYNPFPRNEATLLVAAGFLLSPYTRLTITGALFVDDPGPYNFLREDGHSVGTLSPAGSAAASFDTFVLGIPQQHLAGAPPFFTFVVETGSRPADTLLYLEAFAKVGYSVVSIPEPSTCLMMLAGLGVMGVAARRRRRTLVH